MSSQKIIKRIRLSFSVHPEILKDLDLFAEDLGTSRSNALEIILVRFLPQLTNYNNVTRKAFKTAFENAKRDIIHARKWRRHKQELKEERNKRLKIEVGDSK